MKNTLPWYRMYSEARTDAKLRALSDAEHRVWFHLLCFAAEQDSDGRGSIVGYDDELLAVELCDGDAALLRQTIERLKKLRILAEDENGIIFCAFEKRQYDKPSDKPERVRARVAAYRDRQRQDGNADVTLRNASVSPSIAEQREREDTESETESETEHISDPTVDTYVGDTTRERVAPAASAAPTRGALALSSPPSAAQSTTPQMPTRPARPTNIVPLPSTHQPRAQPTPRTPRPPDPLWDACVAACDGDGKGPSNNVERGKWNKGLSALRQSGATPQEIALRAERYRRRYGPDIALNPMALASNWTVLAQEVSNHANHANHANNHISTAGSSGPAYARRSAGSGGRRDGRRSALPSDNLPDADELREWARRQQALGVNVSGL